MCSARFRRSWSGTTGSVEGGRGTGPAQIPDAMLGMAYLVIFGCVWRGLGAYSRRIGPYLIIFGYLKHPKMVG